MWVKDYMFTNSCTISADMTVKEVVKFMVENKTNSVIVVDAEKKPIGTLSSHTLIREIVPAYLKGDPTYSQFGREGTFDKYAEKAQDKKVSEIMHKDIHALSEDDAMIEAASYAVKTSKRLMPVVNSEGVLIGSITRTCIKNALYNVLHKDKKIVAENGGCCGKYECECEGGEKK